MSDAELVKSKIDIINFLADYITLKRTGRNFKSLCPFHSEKTPSFIVSPERQSWHCFGSCADGGDVITFLQKWENIDFLEALQILAKKVSVTLTKFTPTEDNVRKEKLYAINHLSSEFFHYLLTKHNLGQKALLYLKERKIKEETVNTFFLGYAPNSWDSLMKYLQKKGYQDIDIYQAGLIVKSPLGKYYDRFRGRLMFTLKDTRGNIIGFSGRKLPPQNDKEAKYINTPETLIYNKGSTLFGFDITKESIKKAKEAIIVEGEFDFLASFQSGVTNIVAIKGSALTDNQVILLKRYCDGLLLALDSDFAGNEAAKRGIEIAQKAGLTVKIIVLPNGKDPAECVEKNVHLWKKATQQAVPIYDYIITQAKEKYDKTTIEGKTKIGQEVIPYLSKLQNPIIESHYIRLLSKELQVSEESIELSIRDFNKKQFKPGVVVITSALKGKREDLLEEHLLILALQRQDPTKNLTIIFDIVTPDDFLSHPVKIIFTKMMELLSEHKIFNIADFNKYLSPEITPTFDKAYLSDLGNLLGDNSKFEKEIIKTAREIKKNSVRRMISLLSTKIRQNETEDGKAASFNEQIKKYLEVLKDLEKSN